MKDIKHLEIDKSILSYKFPHKCLFMHLFLQRKESTYTMKRFFNILLAAILIIPLLSSCKKEEPPPPEIWPVEAAGVTISKVPKRVVSLSPSMTENLFVLGYGGRVVGISDRCIIPDASPELPDCGTVLNPDIDAIIKLSPDLVISSSDLPSAMTDALNEIGAVSLVIRYGETLDDIMQNYLDICTAFEGEETGALRQRQLQYYSEEILEYINEEVSSQLDEEVSAIFLRKIPFIIATGDTVEGQLLADMGFINQAEDFFDWSYPPEFEPDLNPRYIFCDESIDIDELRENSYYKQTSAVVNEMVYSVSFSDFERQSPLMFLALENYMREVFPDAFETERPNLELSLPKYIPPEPEKSWWEKLLNK